MKAMIFAAGMGTRLKPFTEKHPKALAEVNNKALLQRNIEYLKRFGISDITLNVHHFPEQIHRFLHKHANFGCKINISDETEELLETGGGLKKAAEFLAGDKPFLVMNVDILTNLDVGKLIAYHTERQPLATLAVTNRATSRYFLFNEKQELCGWKNNKTGEEKVAKKEEELIPRAFSGIHIIDPALFSLIKQEGKFSIVEVYLELCRSHLIMGYDHSTDIFMDVGKPEAISAAEKLFY